MCPQRVQAGIFRNEPFPSFEKEELDLNTWKTIVDGIKQYRPTIQLFGGEPLLYHGVTDLVRYIKARGLRCQMVTNGTLLNAYADKIVDSGLDNIWISLDGPDDVHDNIRNGKGIFYKIIAGIRSINELKRKRGLTSPKLNILYTIMDKNYLHLNEFIDSMSDVQISRIIFSHIIFISKNQYNRQNYLLNKQFGVLSQEWAGYVLDTASIDIEALIDEIHKVMSRGLNNVYFYPVMDDSMISKYYNNNAYSWDKKCYAPWLTAQVHPDGSLAICSDFKVGSMVDSGFHELWNNETSQKFRSMLKKRKLPVCDRCCMIHRHPLFRE
jgi:sulfatase maturation enzyme AslB (radical SAM superfamily)